MEVLVIGASGILGQYLLAEAEERHCSVEGTYHSDPVDGLKKVDLADSTAVGETVKSMKPDVVLLSGAMTSVDGCESHPDYARMVNSEAPLIAAEACRAIGARLVYFSTDYVFDGFTGQSDEEKQPIPINVYGRTKLEGERNVLSVLPSSLVIRTCANFGRNRFRSKENSVTWIINKLRCNESVSLFVDQWVSPSYAPEVAKVTFDLLRKEIPGIFHVASRDCLTRYDIGKRVCSVFKLSEELIKPAKIAEAKLLAPRPSRSCLAIGKVERTLDIRMSAFGDCLAKMKESA